MEQNQREQRRVGAFWLADALDFSVTIVPFVAENGLCLPLATFAPLCGQSFSD
jgi:hypothetical protein